MVFFGYTLPAANNAIRMANLNIALKNDQIKLLNNINSINQNTIMQNIPVGNLIDLNAPVITKPLAKDYLNDLSSISNTLKSKPTIAIKKPGSPYMAEALAKIASPNRGLKTSPKTPAKVNLDLGREIANDEEEKAPPVSSGENTPTLLSRSSSGSSETPTTSGLSGLSDIERDNFNDMKSQFINELNNINDEKLFDAFVNKWRTTALPFNDRMGKPVQIKLPYYNKSDKNKTDTKFVQLAIGQSAKTNIDKSRDLFLNDKKTFIDNFSNQLENSFLSGQGLFKSSGSLASKRAPNFGNLWINEKSLKKNILSIMRPYSNTYELSVKNISSLLKKMIIDIANTLEFDIKDYQNLDSHEKKVIERIINKQKDMKNYNVKDLIGDDTVKMRKRLEILFGQLNSGNNSSIIKAEALDLVRGLFDNGAISAFKRNNLLKNIKSI